MIDLKILTKPTAEQCNNKEKVYSDDHRNGFACWYPQMGGYCGMCIVFIDSFSFDLEDEGCFEIAIWHDGEFPFGIDKEPSFLHHCNPKQFIEFGESVQNLINKELKNEI